MTLTQADVGRRVRIVDRRWMRSFGRGWRIGQEAILTQVFPDPQSPRNAYAWLAAITGSRANFYFYASELEPITPPSATHGRRIG